jgi:hypothetical protein
MNRLIRTLLFYGSSNILGAGRLATESHDHYAVNVGMRAVADKNMGCQGGIRAELRTAMLVFNPHSAGYLL